jgi:hypothetical protein
MHNFCDFLWNGFSYKTYVNYIKCTLVAVNSLWNRSKVFTDSV